MDMYALMEIDGWEVSFYIVTPEEFKTLESYDDMDDYLNYLHSDEADGFEAQYGPLMSYSLEEFLVVCKENDYNVIGTKSFCVY